MARRLTVENTMPTLLTGNPAPGKPGIPPHWTSARKDAVGTAYSTGSRVWFTIWQGIVTEIYYPTIDRPQTRDWQLLITDGSTFFHEERRDLQTEIQYLDPDALAFRIIQREPNGLYSLEKTVIADPHSACVLQRVRLNALPEVRKNLRLYTLCAPHLAGGGMGNNAYIAAMNGELLLTANKGNTWLCLASDKPFLRGSCGYVGISDGWTDLSHNFQMEWQYDNALDGNVAVIGELNTADSDEFVLALSFGHGLHNAATIGQQSLSFSFQSHVDRYIKQWKRATRKVPGLDTKSGDSGKLLSTSFKMLIAHEDKLNPGAFIASLSIPWGEAKGDEDYGGYHLVWPRDMVNSAGGLLAAGNTDTPLRALIFLASAQRDDGGYPQNFWINGEVYWSGIQLDEVSFPIILAWRLYRAGALNDFDPFPMVMRAAAYILRNGPVTQQERWEEVGGFSPSTLAANIAALTCAAAWCSERGDSEASNVLQDYADYLRCHIEDWTVTSRGELCPGIATHFIRVNPTVDPSAAESADVATVRIANVEPGGLNEFPARNVVDAGFLELVRYGIYPAGHSLIVDSLKVVDHVLKVETRFGPCWHRYNHDGYGQRADGDPFISSGIGRAWPLLTGERGHYELAAGNDPQPYIRALERFASSGGTLPEQVWDTDDIPSQHLFLGGPTGSAMPLAWAHAEYIKLLRSALDGKVFDLIPEVKTRYIDQPQVCKLLEIWHKDWQVPAIHPGYTLRIYSGVPFQLIYTFDDWKSTSTVDSANSLMDLHHVDIQAPFQKGSEIVFTFFWNQPASAARWEGKNYTVAVT